MPPSPAPALASAQPASRPADNAQFLRKQRTAVETIAYDNMKLKEELMLENKFSVNPTTQTASALIANLQEQAGVYAAKITEEQRLRAELEHQVEVLRRHIAEQRVQMGGINNSAQQAIKVQRKIKILEDRLQQSSVRYNEMLTRNRALRDRIDGLRRERLLFEELHTKLSRGLERRKAEMVGVIARIAESHEAREKAIILQSQVKAQAEKDVANYEAEWRQLTDIVEQDRRSREAQRQRDIAAREHQMAQLFKQEFTLPSAGTAGSGKGRRPTGRSAASGSVSGADSGAAGSSAGAPLDAALVAAPERVKQLKEAVGKVLEATGAADADDLLEALAAGEEANFSLFNYVNDLTGEVDKLEDSIAGLRTEVERYRSETAAAANDERSQQLRALCNELVGVEASADAYEAKLGLAAVLELLGSEGVTEKTLVQYLGVLEQRTSELLTHYFLLAVDGSTDAAGERAAAVLSGKASAQAPLRFVIEPPSTAAGAGAAGSGAAGSPLVAAGRRHEEEEGGMAGDGERPLSRGSLAARAQRAVAARADTAVKIKAVRAQASSSAGSARR